MVRAPQLELGHFQGQPAGLDRGLESPCLLSPFPFFLQAWLTFRCQLLPLQPVPTASRGSTPVPFAGGEGEAGPSLAVPAGTDALTLCV